MKAPIHCILNSIQRPIKILVEKLSYHKNKYNLNNVSLMIAKCRLCLAFRRQNSFMKIMLNSKKSDGLGING